MTANRRVRCIYCPGTDLIFKKNRKNPFVCVKETFVMDHLDVGNVSDDKESAARRPKVKDILIKLRHHVVSLKLWP